MKIDNTLDGR